MPRGILLGVRRASLRGLIGFFAGLILVCGERTSLTAADPTLPDAASLPAKAAWHGVHPWPPFDPLNPDKASATNLPAGDRFFRPTGPEPRGDVVLSFPVNNFSLPRIVDVSGRYRGVSATASNRNYSVDIAEDESGKLSFLCTVDGLLDKAGGSQIGGVGFIRTVQGVPMMRLRGSLIGTLDGLPLRGNGTFSAPATLTSFSAAAYGLTSTGTYSGKLGDTLFSGRKRQIQIPLLADAGTNIRAGWVIALNFRRKTVGKTERTFVSARLDLPSGNTIQFPERPAHYSKSGYTLSFAGGTNITANPPGRNHRASIGIRSMGLSQQGDSWVVTSGIIRYRFLGQSGTANLVDFLPARTGSATRNKPLSNQGGQAAFAP